MSENFLKTLDQNTLSWGYYTLQNEVSDGLKLQLKYLLHLETLAI